MPQRESIMVVDDEPGICRLLQNVLGEAGYRVQAFQNPHEALREFDREPPDLVVSDVRMPRVTGIDVLKAVKERAPTVPVILITAYGTARTAVEAMKLGTSDFIRKPFRNEDIRLVVEGVMERRRLAAENARLKTQLAVNRSGAAPSASELRPFRDAKRELVERFEKDYLTRLMREAGGSVTRAAAAADMDRKNLYELLRRNGMDPRG